MALADVLLIAVGLAMDAFAVSLAAGVGGHVRRLRPAVRLSFHLGLFQFMMPVIGWYAGRQAAPLIASVDHFVALALLAFVGVRMIRSGLRPGDHSSASDPTRGLTMVALSVATSIDALAIGLSLAMIGVRIWYPSVIIGVVTSVLSLVGTALGGRVGGRLGPVTEIVGGVILIVIGVRIVLSHTIG